MLFSNDAVGCKNLAKYSDVMIQAQELACQMHKTKRLLYTY